MTKNLVLAALLSTTAAFSFAQTPVKAAPAATTMTSPTTVSAAVATPTPQVKAAKKSAKKSKKAAKPAASPK